MKLAVGQFVRVKGFIGKIININEFREPDAEIAIEIQRFNDVVFVNRNEITKASHNIIDLIEVGDVVNGEKVGYIDDLTGAMRQFNYDYENAMKNCGHWQEEIKTILTHEQFENNCYKIGD